MTITPDLFEAYLECPTKCWLRSVDEPIAANEYAQWVQIQNESFRIEAAKRLTATVPADECAPTPDRSQGDVPQYSAEGLKTAKWRLAVNVTVRAELRSSRCDEAQISSAHPSSPDPQPTSQSLLTSVAAIVESRLHAVERVSSESRGKTAQFIPVRFIFTNKPGKEKKMLLAFDSFVLSELLGREVSVGKIIHGDNHATLKVKTGARIAMSARTSVTSKGLASEVRKRIEKIATLLSSPTPPDLVLNRHCAECEFQARCRKIAVEKDDLSLLAGMSAKERQKLRNKGIFTVTQLSYTFRVRRRCKRWKSQQPEYSHALKALAVRDKKVHVIGRPKIELRGTPVYLDVEGTENGLYYLIGCRINARHRSFWADDRSHERTALEGFLDFLTSVPNPQLIFYGRYEHRFLTTMRRRYDDLFGRFPVVPENNFQKPLNLISVIYGKIYFPTYGNTLKDLAKRLGFSWESSEATGLQALVWRAEWESTKDDHLMKTLLRYNAEDCEALELVTDFVTKLCQKDGISAPTADCVRVEELKTTGPFLINKGHGALPEFKAINQAAYWDYQRLRVYVRTNKVIKKASRARRLRAKSHAVRRTIDHLPPATCPNCNDSALQPLPGGECSLVHDIKFLRRGAKACVAYHTSEWCYCLRCQQVVGPHLDHPFSLRKYGPTLRSYGVEQLIRLNIPGATIAKSLSDLFHYELTGEHLSLWKADFAELYGDTVAELTARITTGTLVHADETAGRVVGKSAVVWVFASMEEVVFRYADSREGTMVHELLRGFRGVLVSDFYPVYDSFDCPQQKCLIHLIRDFNDDLHRYPFDSELRQIAGKFTGVLKPIVETIDKRGLKAHFLARHQPSVERFLMWVATQDFASETAKKYAQRVQKNEEKLFTFMRHDGVPWNNNNAENAIRAFAALRERVGGHCTEKSLRHCLILLSISETCKRRGLNFLKFLCSGEKSLDSFAAGRTSRRRARRPEITKVVEKKNDHEDEVHERIEQPTESATPPYQSMRDMALASPSPWDRFRPSVADEVTWITTRSLKPERFDHVPFGGVVLAIPALMESGLWERASGLFPEWIDRPFAEIALLLIASMVLSRTANIEASKFTWPEGWNEVLAKARLPDTPSLVDLINLIGRDPIKAAIWQGDLATKWISDASRLTAVLVGRGQQRVLLEAPAIASSIDRARDSLLAHGLVEPWIRFLEEVPILLLNQLPREGIASSWKQWILPQLQSILHCEGRQPVSSTAAEPHRLTVVFGKGGVDLRFFRRLKKDGLHVFSYRVSADHLWPEGRFTEQEVEVQPGHCERLRTAERELTLAEGLQLREMQCACKNGLRLTIIASDRELDLGRIGAKMSLEFTASRFLNRLQKGLELARSIGERQCAGGTTATKSAAGVDRFLGALALVASRAEAIMEQILRERLSRPMDSQVALHEILCERVDLVPAPGANVLKVLVHAKGDGSEQTAVANLCSQLTATETPFPGTNLRLVYERVSHECIHKT